MSLPLSLRLIAVGLCIGASLSIPSVSSAQSEGRKIKVGFILPLSGPMKSFGTSAQVGFLMSQKKHPAGDIEAIFEDYGYETAEALTAYNKLVDSDKVDVVVVLGSPASLAIAPLSEKRKLPLFSWSASPKVGTNRPSTVRLIPSGDVQGEAMAREALRRKYSAIAFTSAANEYSQAIATGFLSNVAKESVRMNEEFAPDIQDFRSYLTKVKRLKADALGVCLLTVQIPAFAMQARALGITSPIFGCHMMGSEDIVKAAGPALEGAWFIEAKVDSNFYQAFQRESEESAPAWTGAGFYNLAELLHQLIEEGIKSLDIVRNAIGRCITASGYPSSCVVEKNGEVVVEMELGVAGISGSKFQHQIVMPQ